MPSDEAGRAFRRSHQADPTPMESIDSRIARLSAEQRALLEKKLMARAAASEANGAIPRGDSHGPYPLSFAQRAIWFVDQLKPGSPVYNVCKAFRIEGPLSVEALRSALDGVIARHESLRTLVKVDNGHPTQVVLSEPKDVLTIDDLSTVPENDRDDRVNRLIDEAARTPFDLSTGPLVRANLLVLNPRNCVLIVNIHHIVCDEWSLRVYFRELGVLYRRAVGRDAPPLPESPIQLGDFSVWQRRQAEAGQFDDELKYWGRQLDSAPAVLEIPADRRRPATPSFKGGTERFSVSPEAVQAIRELSRSEGVTLFVAALSVFKVLLMRLSGQNDLVVGTPIASRDRPELESAIGVLLNTLPLRTNMGDDPTFRQLLHRVQETTLDALSHKHIPIEKLAEEGSLQTIRPFDAVFALQNELPPAPSLAGLHVEPMAVGNGTAKFDISLAMREMDDGLSGAIEYNTDLFDAATIQRMIVLFQTLLRSVAANPDQRVSRLPILSEGERTRLLVEWSGSEAEPLGGGCLHELVEQQVRRTPNAEALVFENERLSYNEMNRRANRLARHLRSKGMGPETLVGVCLERSNEMAIGLLAVLKAGGAYVPLDPGYPKQRLSFMLDDSAAKLLLTQRKLLSDLPEFDALAVFIDADRDQIARESGENLDIPTSAERLAYVMYTSGSTGRPNGVAVEHRGVAALIEWARRSFSSEQLAGMLFSTSISFDPSVLELFVPLSCGGKAIVVENVLHLPDAPAADEITFVSTVPSAMNELVDASGVPAPVKVIKLGGEALSAALAEKCYERTQAEAVINFYGATECSIDSTYARIDRDDDRPPPIGQPFPGTCTYILDDNLEPVPIGTPGELYLGGVGVARGYHNRPDITAQRFVPDPHSEKPQARMYKTGDRSRFRSDSAIEFLGRLDDQVKIRGFRIELGEVESALAGHPAVQECAAAVKVDHMGDERIVAYFTVANGAKASTSDLADRARRLLPAQMTPAVFVETDRLPRMPNGKIDRKALPDPDRSASGPTVDDSQVEEGVLQSLGRIWADAIGVESAGPGDNFFNLGGHSISAIRVVARIREEFGVEIPIGDFFAAESLADLASWLERDKWVAETETLPNDSEARVEQRASTPRARPDSKNEFVAPRNDLERHVADIWEDLLNVAPIGAFDNFFDLGGHSLRAMALAARIEEEFKVRTPVRVLFETSTLAELAERIDTAEPISNDESIQAAGNRAVKARESPMSFAQQRLWFLDRLEPNQAIYNVPYAVSMKGPLNVDGLRFALDRIVQRHESLRTVFAYRTGAAVQIVLESLDLPIASTDLTEKEEADRERRASEMLSVEASRTFDLERGPLIRALLIKLGDLEHVFMLTMHHIVSDGWSLAVLNRELSILYSAFLEGQSDPLAGLKIQYADYAAWQRDWMAGDVLRKDLAYWKKQLAGPPATLELPTDNARPRRKSYRGARFYVDLSKTLSDSFDRMCRQASVTHYMGLLAAYDVLLSQWCGQTDVVVGSPIAGRDRAETQSLIGFFVNTLVMRTDLSGDPTFSDLLQRVRRTAVEAYAHQGLPFEKLVEELHPERNTSRSPIFQVMFAVQDGAARRMTLPGLEIEPISVETGTTKFDLSVSLSNTKRGLVGSWRYDADLFDKSTIHRLADGFSTLLEKIVTDPHQPLSQLPGITESDRGKELNEWNDSSGDNLGDRCIHRLVEEQSDRSPHAEALVFESERMSYDELNRRANQLARYLRSKEVGSETPVGVCLERSNELAVGLLAVLKAGGACVPLDPAYPKQRLSFMLADSAAKVVLTQKDLLSILPDGDATAVCIDEQRGQIEAESSENLSIPVGPDNLAYVMYTSGSTGRPNGVAVEHRGIVSLIEWALQTFSRDQLSGMLFSTSISFDPSVFELFTPLSCGGKAIIVENALHLPDAPAANEVTFVGGVPSVLNELIELGAVPASVQVIKFGGEALSATLVQKCYARTQATDVFNLYGATECSIDSTYARIAKQDDRPPPIGRPIRGTTAYILDGRLQPAPIGTPGELYLGGVGVARGYRNRPELSAERFLADPFGNEPNARMYKTGDRCRYRPDGVIEFLGRLDDQVKIRGVRIELGEVESALAGHHAVRECAAAVKLNHMGDNCLVAYFTRAEGMNAATRDLVDYVQQSLPAQMTPAHFVELDGLPRMPNGKIDRKALPEPIESEPNQPSEIVPPQDDIEFQLTAIWKNLLGASAIDRRANFFDLGGHSMLAARLIGQIESIFNFQIPFAALFEAPTIAELASILRDSKHIARQTPSVALRTYGSRPPMFWIFDGIEIVLQLDRLLDPNQPLYWLQPYHLTVGFRWDVESASLVSLKEIAANYVRELRRLHPDGPYLLGGFSFGGLIAYEMAQQLRAAGDEVELLFLVDPTPPQTLLYGSGGGSAGLKTKRLPAIHKRAVDKWRNVRTHRLDRLAALAWRKTRKLMTNRLKPSIQTLICDACLRVGRSAPLRFRDFYGWVLIKRAVRSYTARTYEGDACLVTTNSRHKWIWDELIEGRTEFREVKIDHLGLVRGPKASLWIEKLNDRLGDIADQMALTDETS
jgi:amino acid adenylation domain-containing protein